MHTYVLMHTCSHDGCDRDVYTRGWCEKHYRRWRRHGDPTALLRSERLMPCSVDGCEKPSDARGLCHGHYQRVLRGGDVKEDEPLERQKQPKTCSVDGCERSTRAKGLCSAHRRRELKYGDVRADVPIRAATGEGGISHGYRYVPVPESLLHLTNGERWIAEHRLVMAKSLGRPLEPDEVVHHANGVRTDNRLLNLELWSTSHPKGQSVAHKVRWAQEMLARYRPELLARSPEAGLSES